MVSTCLQVLYVIWYLIIRIMTRTIPLHCPGVIVLGGNCPGGSCPGVIVLGVFIMGVIVRG